MQLIQFLILYQVSNLVNFNSSKLTPEYACILQETYSKNNEEVPDDLSRFLKEEKINCEGSAVKEDEPEYEVVKIIRKDSCKVYYLNGYWKEQAISLEVENCEKNVNLIPH